MKNVKKSLSPDVKKVHILADYALDIVIVICTAVLLYAGKIEIEHAGAMAAYVTGVTNLRRGLGKSGGATITTLGAIGSLGTAAASIGKGLGPL